MVLSVQCLKCDDIIGTYKGQRILSYCRCGAQAIDSTMGDPTMARLLGDPRFRAPVNGWTEWEEMNFFGPIEDSID